MQNRSLLDEKLLIDSIPGASIHDGGRIKFGPDGFLYITTGDAAVSNSAQDDKGRLWATEHGSQAHDELNLIEPGKNYGWPAIRGDEKVQGLVSPLIHSDTDTWAPSGIAYFEGSLFFAGLRGQSLFEVIFDDKPTFRRHLNRNFGRCHFIH